MVDHRLYGEARPPVIYTASLLPGIPSIVSFPLRITVALFYAGELGTVLGRILQGQGHRIIAPSSGRSPHTRRRAEESGFDAAASATEAVGGADLVLSVVPPAAAGSVLAEVLCALSASSNTPCFVDANSISPSTARGLQRRCSQAGISMVDMTVHGLARDLPARGDLFLSGAGADAVACLFGPGVSARVVGEEVGEASRFKLLLSSLSKGMTALFLEACANARAAGVLTAYLETTRAFYPGMVTAVERMLPSYPRHAPRRAEELREAEAMLLEMNQVPGMIHEARILLERLAVSPVCSHPESVPLDEPLALLAAIVDAVRAQRAT